MTYSFRALPDMVVVRADGPFDASRTRETLDAVAAVRSDRGIPGLVWDARRRTSAATPEDVRRLTPLLGGWHRIAFLTPAGPVADAAHQSAGMVEGRACVCPDSTRALRWIRTGQRCRPEESPAGASVAPERPHEASPEAPRRHRVLLIDDDAAVRRTATRILEVGGYEVVEAEDGRDGVDALVHGRFSLVITDLYMSGVEGIETIRRIRELDADIPIIAISGSFEETGFTALEDAKLMGADLAVAKPFSIEGLLESVRKLIER